MTNDKELKLEKKLDFLEFAMKRLDTIKRNLCHQDIGLCIIYDDFRKFKSIHTDFTDKKIAEEFPELYDEIVKAKKKHGDSLYIEYKYAYRFKGRESLLLRVEKRING